MKIPKTTKAAPYIEFRFTEKWELKLRSCSTWWGGINSGFISSDGSTGNTCYPEDLDKYIAKFKKNKADEINKEIARLQKKLEKIKKL